ncbi:SusC/RagA family TonB-linked outer membrane protein [Chryseobacterium salipaludis]|uniref:SusC/RagA family TonB-linked outer membrane protein n=1 Tax=Chryseobacterium TaxID=59732 RepID=UPI001FF5BF43|nr:MULTISPECIES: SusC/RagA family TonB-linked outer membrane protein [Chryseobacterium]MCJ8497182.1 SusC/RagA family TonB-linked outer membrane protein [Chryseobacterium salipaludis]MCX3295589.1 SusC/RagA family TonB-linked outer membrane protein [Planobacterium sp. JC490]
MNVKLRVLSAGVLFFVGTQAAFAQQKRDSVKTEDIEEVVVLGYSKTSTKAKSTAASTTISSEVLENRPNISFLNSVQGAAPGIQINAASGSPGSGKIDVRIRGLASLNASTDPLYVIDGLATSGNQFRNLNPNDIETISVLRDAQATSIYGNRGANGVVIITTKGGRFNSGLRLSYDALTSFSTYPESDYNLADAKQLLTIHKNYGAGLGATLTDEQINNYPTNTDWNKEFFRVGMLQQHNLGIRFGGENIAAYSSLGYLDSEGSLLGTDFKRFTFRNNLNGKSKNNRFTYNSQLAVGYSKRHQLDQETNGDISNNVVQNPLFGPVLAPATLQPYPFINGQDMYNQIKGSTSGRSTWILQDIIRGGIANKFTETSVLANAAADYKLTDYLSVGNKTGIDFKESDREFARTPTGYLSVNVAAGQQAQYGGLEDLTNTKDFTVSSVTNLTYNQSFDEHSLTVGAYLDYIKGHYISKGQRQNGLNPLNWELGAGTGYVPFNPATPNLYRPTVNAFKYNAGTLAYFATVDYDYASKYGLSGVVRRDGSYRFSEENRWETFWSVAGRWNIDREDFLEGSSVRMLKLRASYGTQGNQNLFKGTNNMNPLFVRPNMVRDVLSTNTGYGNLPGFGVGVIANENLKWEKISQFNVGLDFGLFNNKLEGNFDYYIKKTSDMFNDISISAVTSLYTINGNNGEMENRGVEGLLRYNVIRNNDIKVSVFANAAYNKNKILAMDTEDLQDDIVNAIGGVAYQWHLYPFVGVNPDTGEQQFLDINGNITEEPTEGDRRLTGKSYLPKLSGGFGVDLDYKGFYFNALFTYQTGGWIYDNLYSWLMDPSTAASYNGSADLLNSWTPNNTNTNIPAIDAYNAGTEGSSDRFLYKSDYLRLKNASIGYGFTKDQLGNLPIKALRVFAQAENIYTWTEWKGFDPEPIGQFSLGIYPNPKTFSVGFNVEF